MSSIRNRIDSLTSFEIRNLIEDLSDLESYKRVIGGHPIDHVTQAEIRTLFARHDFPISKEEVRPACQRIAECAHELEEFPPLGHA